MSETPIRYGIAGLGRAGWNIHANQLRPRSDAKIVAVADLLEDRRQEAENEFGCQSYENLDQMLDQDDIDLIVVATPNVYHASDSIKSLRKNKHVVCEKPMALNLDEADAMIAASKEADRKLFIHHNYRFHLYFTHLKEIIASGILGQIYHIRNYSSGFRRRDDWQTLSKNGGGVLNNTCPHNIDMILQLINSPIVDVMGDLQQIASGGDVEDHVKALIRAENGCTADLEVSSAQNIAVDLPRWMVCGSNGTLTSDGKQSTIRWFDPEFVGDVEVHEGAAFKRSYISQAKPIEWQEKTIDAKGPNIGNFYDNVTAVIRRGEPMIATPDQARDVVRVTELIRKGTKFDR